MSEEISLSEIEKLESYYFDLIKSSLGETAALKRELESQNKLMKQFLSPVDRVAVETNTKSYFDQGAERAIKLNKSLLPAGVIEIKGKFNRGDVITVHNKSNVKTGQRNFFPKYRHGGSTGRGPNGIL